MFEKSKIRSHLRKVGRNKSPFDILLSDYLTGKLKREFQSEKIKQTQSCGLHGHVTCVFSQGSGSEELHTCLMLSCQS